jgi:hypothetical protein
LRSRGPLFNLRNALMVSFVIFMFSAGASPVFGSSSPHNSVSPVAFGSSVHPSHVSPSKSPSSVKLLCSTGTDLTGIYQGPGGGAFVVDVFTGDLIWCASGVSSVIATPPNGTALGYYGMAGVHTGIGLVLVLSDNYDKGFWFCFGATPSGCAIESTFIHLPSGFCSSLTSGNCYEQGVAMDNKLNLYFADVSNGIVFKCTYASAYQSCTVLENLGYEPIYIFRDSSGNLWVSDYSSTGNVWKNGVVKYTVGQSLYGITVSKANSVKAYHVYVSIGDGGIEDLNDGKFLPTASSDYVTLTSTLQYAGFYSGSVYKTSDKA